MPDQDFEKFKDFMLQSQAQAEASIRLAADWVKQNLAVLVEGPPTVTSGEVTLHTVT